jgi:hypothetical protein
MGLFENWGEKELKKDGGPQTIDNSCLSSVVCGLFPMQLSAY